MTDTSRSGELKPCPFCGGEADIRWHQSDCFVVSCTVCRAEGPPASGDEAQDAIDAWNNRPADRIEALEAENERLREALQWMVDNDETNEGDEPMEEFGGQSWNEINAYWIEGLNRARAALGEKQ